VIRPQAALDSGMQEGRLRRWPGSKRTATEEIIPPAGVGVGRCRDAIRNTPWGRKAVDTWSCAVIGTGIKPSPRLDNKTARERLLEDWRDWTDESDADGRTDFYGQQRLAARELMAAGEAFFRRRWRRPQDGLVVPFQIQCIASEQLPVWLTGPSETVGATGSPAGNQIRAGIEFDAIGRRTAYHFLRLHPGDAAYRLGEVRSVASAPDQLVRVPAEDVIHVYDTEEPGQIRGMPRMAAGIVRLYEADRFIDAQQARQHMASCVAIVVEPPADGVPAFAQQPPAASAEDALNDSGDRNIQDIELAPGTLIELRPGETWKPLAPPQLAGEFDPFMYRVACDVAVAFGIPYLGLTGDASKADYSSERASQVRWWREVEPIQHQTIVHQLCRPVWRWFIDAGLVGGTLRLPGYARNPRRYLRLDWIAHKWEWVDPLKDMQARDLQMKAGIISREHVQDEMGLDPQQEDESIAASQARAKELGLKIGADAMVPETPPEEPGDDEEEPEDDGA